MNAYNSLLQGINFRRSVFAQALSCAAVLTLAGAPASRAGDFNGGPPPLNETTFSIGVFKIVVEPAFAPTLTGYPGWRASTRELTSPVLTDSNTQIGRSAAHVHGDASAYPVGAGPATSVQLSDYSAAPYLVPGPFQTPGAVREVFTEVRRLVLEVSGQGSAGCDNRVAVSGSPAHGVPAPPVIEQGVVLVKAGSQVVPPLGLPACLGQVQSLVPGGGPASDFPARSFFDIFAEMNVPSLGGAWPGALFTNTAPIIVQNPALTEFPPRATYIHGISVAVPLVFKSAVPAIGAAAGQLFGYMTLAGHGVFTNCPNDTDTLAFLDTVLGPNGTKPGAPILQHVPTDLCPPAYSSYVSPAGTPPVSFTIPGLGAILVRNFRHSNLLNPISPPTLGNSATYQGIGTRLDAEISQDGGQTWQAYYGFGNVVVGIGHTSDSGSSSFFDTEMLQLSISGGSLPAGAMLRESPTLQSTGQHTIRNMGGGGGGGGYEDASFFDVFLELSLDGGVSWIPASGATRVELSVNPPPANIPTLSEWGLIILTLLLLTVGTLALRRTRARLPAPAPA